MPLVTGADRAAISSNIREMLRSDTFGKGKDHKTRHRMAVAAALSKAKDSGPVQNANASHDVSKEKRDNSGQWTSGGSSTEVRKFAKSPKPGWFKRNRKTIALSAAGLLLAAGGGYAAHQALKRRPDDPPMGTSSGPQLPPHVPTNPLPQGPSLADAFKALTEKHNAEAARQPESSWGEDPHATAARASEQMTQLQSQMRQTKDPEHQAHLWRILTRHYQKAQQDLKDREKHLGDKDAYTARRNLESLYTSFSHVIYREPKYPVLYPAPRYPLEISQF